jgi:hypothetical protein
LSVRHGEMMRLLQNKTCKKCNLEAPISEFHKSKTGKYGVKSECKSCSNKYRREHYAKPEAKKHKLKYEAERKKNNPRFKLSCNMRTVIRNSCKRQKFSQSTTEILGCSFADFKIHIEKQFEPWMNWQNWGVLREDMRTWQIDHIAPLSKAKDMIAANHYTNLRPLCSKANISKGNRRNP